MTLLIRYPRSNDALENLEKQNNLKLLANKRAEQEAHPIPVAQVQIKYRDVISAKDHDLHLKGALGA